MSDENTSSNNRSRQQEAWPGKLNKVLIGVGVLAFGLIIADRLVEMFRAEQMPETTVTVLGADSLPAAETLPEAEPARPNNLTVVVDESEQVPDIEDVFGSRLVFVSTSEPLYVVTEDDRRFNVGGEIDTDTTLAGITGDRVILEKAGDLLIIRLHDPVVQ